MCCRDAGGAAPTERRGDGGASPRQRPDYRRIPPVTP